MTAVKPVRGGRERLGGEVERLLWTGRPAAKERENRSEVPLVEDAERFRTGARSKQKLRIRALLLHVSYMTIPRDL